MKLGIWLWTECVCLCIWNISLLLLIWFCSWVLQHIAQLLNVLVVSLCKPVKNLGWRKLEYYKYWHLFEVKLQLFIPLLLSLLKNSSDFHLIRFITLSTFAIKHFPVSHILHKIFNKNTVKISYGYTKNINSVISSHKKSILNPRTTSFGCNC